jgi:hypothetical protein
MLVELSGKSENNDLREDHRDDFTEHDSLSFDTTDTPAGNTETVDHSGVGVGTDNGIRVQDSILVVENDTGQILKIDLMNNT